MFNSTFKQTVLSTLAATVVATSFSINPALAGGGGGRDPAERVSTISTVNPDGSKTSIRSRNAAKTFTLTRTKNGKVVNKKRINKNRGTFVTIHNPDGTSRTITKPSKPSKAFVTIHNADGTSRTVTKPSKPGKAFVTLHNADGTSTTITGADR
ncbi:hypothetical protein [Roseovarius pelagicus]|uniref:Uncharacterized protein n=1 Tax=Roseovarius pelagicus TaxID=2980108 RepID=A0ABY6D8Y3_9RHOB|nr:hypothetical protein [Roseovarius pelagicus]UXX82538.1 hypothetical protein N7U68_15765 [Roseovarius pelagicus]